MTITNHSKTNICFIANYTKTYLFDAVAKKLGENNINIFWVAVNIKLYNYLRQQYPKENVLLVNLQHENNNETPVGEFKINELIYGDRSLRVKPEAAKKYLISIQSPIYNFLKNNSIDYVIGELTWAHELLIHRMVTQCKELQAVYLNPHTIRIPNGHFAFFTDEYQSQIFEFSNDIEHTNREISIEKPDYLLINDKINRQSRTIRNRLSKIKRFITEENIDKMDPTLITNRWQRFKIRVMEEVNKELYRFVDRINIESIGDKPFVFVALHKQPEASIDVLGRYYEDQYQNIINLWRVLPNNWFLIIKEHTNAIGDRSLSFYRGLQKYPGVKFINEKTDSHELIRRSNMVATVSGTVAYEAALMGKAAITFAPTFFSKIGPSKRISYNDLNKINNIYELIDKKQNNLIFSQYIHLNSFQGIISDPISNPNCLSDINIEHFRAAILKVINK